MGNITRRTIFDVFSGKQLREIFYRMEKSYCIHCGEDCGKNPVMWDGKPFCCYGCKAVYQILHEKDLTGYYKIAPMSGIKTDGKSPGTKYAYLDEPEIREKLIEFSDGETEKVRLFIPAIHCSSCIWLLENLNTLDPGVVHSSVNFVKKEVSISYRVKTTSLRKIAELLESIHYIPEITLEKADRDRNRKSNKILLIKTGIAGFSFANIMLYSFPEYLPGKEFVEDFLKNFFGWMSLLLALPVVFYSASDYYLSAIKSLRKKIVNIDLPVALGITTLFIQSAVLIFEKRGPGYMDSLTGLVFFLLIGKWYQGKSYQALSFERSYRSFFPVAITKISGKKKTMVPLKDLKEGDHILIRNQEIIPADSEILEGSGSIDYSFVTGESLPVEKKAGDLVYAGGRQTGKRLLLKINKSIDQSRLTQLWNQYQHGEQESKGLEQVMNKVSEYFTFIILAIATAAAIFWIIKEPGKAVFAFTSVLIIACPCALALTIPFTFGSTMRWFGKAGFYLKETRIVENLSKTDTLVFDKTGTLTYSGAIDISWEGLPLSDTERSMIRTVAEHSSHPMSRALTDYLQGSRKSEPDLFKEIPGMGISAEVNRKKINIGSAQFVRGDKDQGKVIPSAVHINIENNYKGYFAFHNRYREGVKELITKMGKKMEIHLLSGDNDAEFSELLPLFNNAKYLNFNQSPQDKLNYIKNLKNSGRRVLMIGDGLNDAGALRESDVGITIADDVFQFSPACDAILESGKLKYLNRFTSFTHASMKVVVASFIISFLYNVIGLSFAVGGSLSPVIAAILMPASSVSVVAFATFSTSLVARFKGIKDLTEKYEI